MSIPSLVVALVLAACGGKTSKPAAGSPPRNAEPAGAPNDTPPPEPEGSGGDATDAKDAAALSKYCLDHPTDEKCK